MRHGIGSVSLVTAGCLAFFVVVGVYIENLSGIHGGPEAEGAVSIDPDTGKRLFWGKGTCSNCHKIGAEGSATRGPDLAGIGKAAEDRAKEISEKRGVEFDRNDYFIESVADPKAYEVAGYEPSIMPKLYETVPLRRDEFGAILTYLQTEGGDPDPDAVIERLDRIPEPKEGGTKGLWGDPEAGEALFFDEKGKAGCVKCHRIGDLGADIGPDLTGIGGIQGPEYLAESIVFPSRVIVKGFDEYIVRDLDERQFSGIVKEKGDVVEVYDQEGKLLVALKKEDIDVMQPTGLSGMPGNFAYEPNDPKKPGTLDMKEIFDIVAYLMTQR